MRTTRWLLALPLLLATSLTTASAASIRDEAGLFSADAVRQAQTKLDRIERESRLTTTIETIDSLQGQRIEDVSLRHAQQTKSQGIFILIAKQEKKLEIRVSKQFRADFPDHRLTPIRDRFLAGFRQKDFDAGLIQGVDVLAAEAKGVQPRGGDLQRRAAGGAPARPAPARPTSGIGTLLGIGLAVLAILFVVRLLGSLFGGQRAGYPGGSPMAGPGPGGPGYGGPQAFGGGPGYGGPGYGGGRGGFWSSMFGGIGGALAGNWLYDQFSGRHHQSGSHEGSFYGDGGAGSSGVDPTSGGDDWGGGGGVSGDWGGGDDGGGDWGGGGGGDWGGGGDGGGDGDW